MPMHALVMAEAKDDRLRQVTFEALAAARFAAGDGGRVSAALFGTGAERFAAELAREGASRVYIVPHRALDRYTPDGYAQAWVRVIREAAPDAVIAPHTAAGRDAAAKTAARLGAGLISDVTGIARGPDGELRFTRPIYAGKALETRRFREGPLFVTIRPNNIPRAAGGTSAGGTANSPDGAGAEIIRLDEDIRDLRTVVTDIVRKAAGGVDLTEARVVVAGGRGVKSAEGFAPLRELAEALGGAVGASRGACDAGYCDYALQIGQTGKVVTPDLYIACGISGAIQHLAGMAGSRIIVAVNKDPDAPIFQAADYGIVGDLFEVVPLLTERIRRMREDAGNPS